MKKIYKIGTRESKLALIQTEIVCKSLVAAHPNLNMSQFELVKIKTIGDKILNKNLVDIGGKNLFIKEIEEALLSNHIDFAVHSLKDMTAILDSRLVIAACLEREDPRDAFVSFGHENLQSLPQGALIGTSSVRRKALALSYRPDLMCVPFRGNVLTRLEKLRQKQVDATFLAIAGLKRLEIDNNLYYPLSLDDFLPAPSQGVIGVECNKNDHEIYDLLRKINHSQTELCNQAERGFLEAIEANCYVPIAAFAELLPEDKISLKCQVVDSHNKIYQAHKIDSIANARKIGFDTGLEMKGYLEL